MGLSFRFRSLLFTCSLPLFPFPFRLRPFSFSSYLVFVPIYFRLGSFSFTNKVCSFLYFSLLFFLFFDFIGFRLWLIFFCFRFGGSWIFTFFKVCRLSLEMSKYSGLFLFVISLHLSLPITNNISLFFPFSFHF
jgi:hypothetical protein